MGPSKQIEKALCKQYHEFCKFVGLDSGSPVEGGPLVDLHKLKLRLALRDGDLSFVKKWLREADKAAAAGDMLSAWRYQALAVKHMDSARQAKSMVALGPPP